jgi:hypothetical protein
MNLLSLVGPRLNNICQIRRKQYYSSGSNFLQSKRGLGWILLHASDRISKICFHVLIEVPVTDWWVPLSMWDNGDKRSNLICPVGSWILLAVYPFFFYVWYTALHTYDGVFGSSQLLPSHSWMGLCCLLNRNGSCDIASTAILDQMTCTNYVSECLVCSSMQWPNTCQFLSCRSIHQDLKV